MCVCVCVKICIRLIDCPILRGNNYSPENSSLISLMSCEVEVHERGNQLGAKASLRLICSGRKHCARRVGESDMKGGRLFFSSFFEQFPLKILNATPHE